MSELPMKTFWMGEDIETLPRERLVEIILYLAQQAEIQRAMTRSIIELNEMARARQSHFIN